MLDEVCTVAREHVDDIAEKEHQVEMMHFPKIVEEILKNAAD